jgi:DNA-binding transcriptional regulator YhcF (GntR family)
MSQKVKNTIISNTAKHIQIANIVREQILNGDFSPGTRLCSDAELAEQYHIHRHTVAEGLKILAEEGLLERAPRRGSIVSGRHKEPVYLLIACPGFLDENNNSAVFVRRLYKNLHLQLMVRGISVITVPMSPTNNSDDILEKYFDIIPAGAKVIFIGEWGLQGLECLKKRNCNVVFYDFQNAKRSKLVEKNWKKLVFDRPHGAYNAIEELAKNGFVKPLLVLKRNSKNETMPRKTVRVLEAQAEYYPDLSQKNILWCDKHKFADFAAKFNDLTQKISFDSIYFPDVELARVVLNVMGNSCAKGIISNDTTEIISAPELCHYAIDPEGLAKMTIELFDQPASTEQIIKPKLYNVNAL